MSTPPPRRRTCIGVPWPCRKFTDSMLKIYERLVHTHTHTHKCTYIHTHLQTHTRAHNEYTSTSQKDVHRSALAVQKVYRFDAENL
mmetsp:Transcript_28595/g.45950  ORF Transcript_28595/g.45950 Transcript_28595/m.45950 type:complete len:86 (+) Transcript_28595:83-340(+)